MFSGVVQVRGCGRPAVRPHFTHTSHEPCENRTTLRNYQEQIEQEIEGKKQITTIEKTGDIIEYLSLHSRYRWI